MDRKALIVTDMLNDFVREGAPLDVGPAVRAIIPRVKAHIDRVRREGGVVIFVADHHAPDDPEFKLWPPHAVRDTAGAQVIEELGRRPEDPLVYKTRYSAFYGTKLESILRQEQVTEVEIVGVCTSICVMYTTSDLRNRDMPVTVHRDAVADLGDAAHGFALEHMRKILGACVV